MVRIHLPQRRESANFRSLSITRSTLATTCSGGSPGGHRRFDGGADIAAIYVRMNPSISLSAQSIAALIDLPDCVHWAINFMIVACAHIWVPILSGAG